MKKNTIQGGLKFAAFFYAAIAALVAFFVVVLSLIGAAGVSSFAILIYGTFMVTSFILLSFLYFALNWIMENMKEG